MLGRSPQRYDRDDQRQLKLKYERLNRARQCRFKQEILICVRNRLLEITPLRDQNPWQCIKRMMPCPEPDSSTERKYVYFYNPYNYAINTKKHMEFEEAQDWSQVNGRRCSEAPGWQKVRGFIKNSNEEALYFALNQLRRRMDIPPTTDIRKTRSKHSVEKKDRLMTKIETLFA